MRWSTGDKVMAKWPGSALYFPGIIQDIDEDDDSAEVLFNDGTTMDVPIKHIKKEEEFKRRARSKSPARSRRRSQSPGRRRTTRATAKKDTEVGKANQRNNTSSSSGEERKVTAILRSDVEVSQQEHIKTTKTTKSHSKVETNKTVIPDSGYMVTRQQVKEMYMSKAAILNAKQAEETPTPVVKDTKQYEYGGVLGVFLMYVTLPLLPLSFLVFCNKEDCSISKAKLSMIPQTLEAYFDQMSIFIVLEFLVFHAIIYALPLGHIIKGPATPSGKRLDYRINAMYTLVLTLAAYAVLYHYKVPITSIKMLPLAATATVVSYIGVLLVHLKSKNVPENELNPHGNTGSDLYDSFLGRELHPRIGSLFDLKLYLYRPGMAAWLVVVMVEMQRHYEQKNMFEPQVLVVGISQILYIILEFFWDEEQCPFMFDIKNEGLGFVQFFGELVIVPFIYSQPITYVVNHPLKLQNTQIAGICLLLFVGICLIVLSGRQKSKFRKNPFDPKLAHLESLPPSKAGGDRLLVSGFWGLVRHPNYLGEIVVGLAWSLACGFNHLLPWFYPIFVIGLLLHRAIRDDVRCREKHGKMWKVYCERVKYRVIPYVF
uniref:Delta(14)-sterol reductase-like n=1 Tax=Ciona intestinalis TaxID=7719 RepID=F7ATI9_CIOIN|nr:delta(14)-sterol reductase-like [Ciona intestinalis]|eukprot:XP_002126360.1 delta(14)-sterol reductase-like [Ciona intestinalis]